MPGRNLLVSAFELWIHDPLVESDIVDYQDEMAQRYVKNALARARARKERDTSEAEEISEGD